MFLDATDEALIEFFLLELVHGRIRVTPSWTDGDVHKFTVATLHNVLIRLANKFRPFPFHAGPDETADYLCGLASDTVRIACSEAGEVTIAGVPPPVTYAPIPEASAAMTIARKLGILNLWTNLSWGDDGFIYKMIGPLSLLEVLFGPVPLRPVDTIAELGAVMSMLPQLKSPKVRWRIEFPPCKPDDMPGYMQLAALWNFGGQHIWMHLYGLCPENIPTQRMDELK